VGSKRHKNERQGRAGQGMGAWHGRAGDRTIDVSRRPGTHWIERGMGLDFGGIDCRARIHSSRVEFVQTTAHHMLQRSALAASLISLSLAYYHSVVTCHCWFHAITYIIRHWSISYMTSFSVAQIYRYFLFLSQIYSRH
jgi:hypothetical protein